MLLRIIGSISLTLYQGMEAHQKYEPNGPIACDHDPIIVGDMVDVQNVLILYNIHEYIELLLYS